MDSAKQQIVDGIKSTSNILVSVSTDPSVDELSAALGLTLLLDKLDKRATAVFSGAIPPAINFLEPDKTFESTANSLQDFIIALDKEKADHLRYKVDGDVVKIFITPYKTALSQSDLEFSQGDYNVEMVIALGVKDQDHLDKALEAHGKILHDAKVMTITAGADKSTLGSADWQDDKASSLSEMVVSLADTLKTGESLLDQQIATALLTGIVSATDRFSNNKTSSGVMTLAAQLMASGANQQLIVAKLEDAQDIAPGQGGSVTAADNSDTTASDETELSIDRSSKQKASDQPTLAQLEEETSEQVTNQAELEEHLANLVPAPGGTMADIERELHGAAGPELDSEQSTAMEPVTTSVTDASMPGFEPTDLQQPVVTEQVDRLESTTSSQAEQQQEPQQDEQSPQIINEHGSSMELAPPPDSMPPLNAVSDQPAEPIVDVFASPVTAEPQQGATVNPAQMVGTPEGAAALSQPLMPEQSPAIAPVAQPQPVMPVMPPLPPLPPLPGDVSLPPLPPPPPLPTTFAPGPVQAGPVSGDVFGDTSTALSATPPPASEPGQFKIPGQ